MIDILIGIYKEQYDMRYDPKTKTLFIYTPMLVKDYVHLKRLIKIKIKEIEDIRIIGSSRWEKIY